MIQTKTESALSGDLQFISLADLLQLFGSSGASGVLRLKSPYSAEIGIVYFDNGNPIESLSGSSQGLDALYSLFGWIEGTFEFRAEKVTAKKGILKSRMEIILDGLSMLDDGDIPTLGPAAVSTETDAPAASSCGPTVIRGPMVDYMYVVDEETLSDGQKIVVEGKHGGWIWVILEGCVEVERDSDKGGPLSMLHLGDGNFVGSFASLTMSGHKRKATVTARSSVQLGVLDSQRLNTDFTRLSENLKKLLLSCDRRLHEITDRAVEFREGQFDLEPFVRGKKPVIKQGQDENRLFRIEAGDAVVVRITKGGQIPLARLTTDDCFGRIPMVETGHEPFSASVYGSEDLKVSHIDPDTIQGEYDTLSPTMKNMISGLGSSIAATTQVACRIYREGRKKK
jgi:Domain of unknown function (DUF4388)/Cyclic nucleotide-binding domain